MLSALTAGAWEAALREPRRATAAHHAAHVEQHSGVGAGPLRRRRRYRIDRSRGG